MRHHSQSPQYSSFDAPIDSHANNPYAEWYYNTIRFPGCPAQKHHEEVYKNAPYDQFLDHWKAPDFNAQALMKVFKRAGAKYFVPVV